MDTLFPIKNQALWDCYNEAKDVTWTYKEIDFSGDKNDWDKLSADLKHCLKHVLAYFAVAESQVLENLVRRFWIEVEEPEAQLYYCQQIDIEATHKITYELLIVQYITDESERYALLNGMNNAPHIVAKQEWANKWIEGRDSSFNVRTIAFAFVEGIFFAGSFALIYKVTQNCMKGLFQSNQLISRDENSHARFASVLYKLHSDDKVDEPLVHEMAAEAVNIEKAFWLETLGQRRDPFPVRDMYAYIEYIADYWLQELGYGKLFGTINPFPFMNEISMRWKTNQFERRPTEYQAAGAIPDGNIQDWLS